MNKIFVLLMCTLAGCSSSSSWTCDAIMAQDSRFDSKRLLHEPENGHPPWRIEWVRVGDAIDMFISLKQSAFRGLAGDPASVPIALHIQNGEKLEGKAPLFQGEMKLQVPLSLSNACIQALLEGKTVTVIAGGLKETIEPEEFKEIFSQFLKTGYDWYKNIQPANKAFL